MSAPETAWADEPVTVPRSLLLAAWAVQRARRGFARRGAAGRLPVGDAMTARHGYSTPEAAHRGGEHHQKESHR